MMDLVPDSFFWFLLLLTQQRSIIISSSLKYPWPLASNNGWRKQWVGRHWVSSQANACYYHKESFQIIRSFCNCSLGRRNQRVPTPPTTINLLLPQPFRQSQKLRFVLSLITNRELHLDSFFWYRFVDHWDLTCLCFLSLMMMLLVLDRV